MRREDRCVSKASSSSCSSACIGTDRQREREKDREGQRRAEKGRERERDRKRETERERERQRKTEKDRDSKLTSQVKQHPTNRIILKGIWFAKSKHLSPRQTLKAEKSTEEKGRQRMLGSVEGDGHRKNEPDRNLVI